MQAGDKKVFLNKLKRQRRQAQKSFMTTAWKCSLSLEILNFALCNKKSETTKWDDFVKAGSSRGNLVGSPEPGRL